MTSDAQARVLAILHAFNLVHPGEPIGLARVRGVTGWPMSSVGHFVDQLCTMKLVRRSSVKKKAKLLEVTELGLEHLFSLGALHFSAVPEGPSALPVASE